MLYNAIAVVVIPFLVQLLKKLKLPVKLAPYAAVVLAVVYIIVAKAAGLPGVELNTALDAITKILGIAGTSVLGYDIVKKIGE